jgi:hypothetical protein
MLLSERSILFAISRGVSDLIPVSSEQDFLYPMLVIEEENSKMCYGHFSL